MLPTYVIVGLAAVAYVVVGRIVGAIVNEFVPLSSSDIWGFVFLWPIAIILMIAELVYLISQPIIRTSIAISNKRKRN